MTRIATFTQSQTLSAELMRLQQSQFQTQKQVTTGKVSDQFKDIPRQAGVLLSAKGLQARIDQYTNTAAQTKTRLEVQDTHLEALADVAGTLRAAISEAYTSNSGIAVAESIDAAFREAVSFLNANFDGQYIFAGSRTDTPPVISNQITDLVAAATAQDLFANNTLKASVRVDDHHLVEYGMLADELGFDLFTAIRDIAVFDAGVDGPFGKDMTPAQQTFLEGMLPTLEAIDVALNSAVATNGIKLNEVEKAIDRHADADIFVKTLISDIEDVDLAEAITRLNADQVAVEASTRVLAQLGRLSLLDFI